MRTINDLLYNKLFSILGILFLGTIFSFFIIICGVNYGKYKDIISNYNERYISRCNSYDCHYDIYNDQCEDNDCSVYFEVYCSYKEISTGLVDTNVVLLKTTDCDIIYIIPSFERENITCYISTPSIYTEDNKRQLHYYENKKRKWLIGLNVIIGLVLYPIIIYYFVKIVMYYYYMKKYINTQSHAVPHEVPHAVPLYDFVIPVVPGSI